MPVTILCVPCKNIYTNLHKFVRQAPNFPSSIYIFISHDKLCARRTLISLLISMTNMPSNTLYPPPPQSGHVWSSEICVVIIHQKFFRIHRQTAERKQRLLEVTRWGREMLERLIEISRDLPQCVRSKFIHSNCFSTSSSKAHSPWAWFVTLLRPCSAV